MASPPPSVTSTQELLLLHIDDLLSSTTNPIHSFADDRTMHASIMSNRPISVVELECRRLVTAKVLEAITAWRYKNMVEFNALFTLYRALVRPSLDYCSHIWRAAAPTTLSILDAVQKKAIRLIGGMRNTLLSALRAIPVCRAAAHILAARMQKAVILGSLRLLRAHDTRTQ
nr:unnamed protein product [Callosobruchus chinensis]